MYHDITTLNHPKNTYMHASLNFFTLTFGALGRNHILSAPLTALAAMLCYKLSDSCEAARWGGAHWDGGPHLGRSFRRGTRVTSAPAIPDSPPVRTRSGEAFTWLVRKLCTFNVVCGPHTQYNTYISETFMISPLDKCRHVETHKMCKIYIIIIWENTRKRCSF